MRGPPHAGRAFSAATTEGLMRASGIVRALTSADRWRDREYVGRPGLSPVLAGLVASGVLSPGLDVLDVGCGRGADALPLAALGVRVTGVDVNRRSLTHARRRAKALGLDARFVDADVTRDGLPFPSRSYDAVVDTLLLNNLDDEELDHYAAEVARVLRRRGLLVVQHKVGRHAAHWHPHDVPPEVEARFELGLPVHTHLAEKGGRAAAVAVMVGKKK